LPAIDQQGVYISGDVMLDPTVAIAPGAILRADPGSRIVIQSGVCIGMGVVLHAHGGTIEIESGCNLGPGVLIVGQSKVGQNACIGAATTVINTSIDPVQVIPAGSVLGDTSRQVTLDPVAPSPEPRTSLGNGVFPKSIFTPHSNSNPAVKAEHVDDPWEADSDREMIAPDQLLNSEMASEQIVPPSGNTFIGQMYVNRLMVTLFPHNRIAPIPVDE
jgi:carbon dioxide concentrating mechanism protein CcmN